MLEVLKPFYSDSTTFSYGYTLNSHSYIETIDLENNTLTSVHISYGWWLNSIQFCFVNN